MGQLVSYRDSLKLFHWHVSGDGSYATHMALDQAVEQLEDPIDGFIETCYSLYGDLDIVIPETKRPDDIIKHVQDFYQTSEKARDIVKEDFLESIIDDIQEANQQLLFRLRRLR
jgi:DNA-binding ferritin-like protein